MGLRGPSSHPNAEPGHTVQGTGRDASLQAFTARVVGGAGGSAVDSQRRGVPFGASGHQHSTCRSDSRPSPDPCPHLLIDIDVMAVVLQRDDQCISLGLFAQRVWESRLTADKDVQ